MDHFLFELALLSMSIRTCTCLLQDLAIYSDLIFNQLICRHLTAQEDLWKKISSKYHENSEMVCTIACKSWWQLQRLYELYQHRYTVIVVLLLLLQAVGEDGTSVLPCPVTENHLDRDARFFQSIPSFSVFLCSKQYSTMWSYSILDRVQVYLSEMPTLRVRVQIV